MASTWFYYDNSGQKQGPITAGQLKGLAKQGTITPETVVETEEGKTAPAGKIQGLQFSEPEPVPPVTIEKDTASPIPSPVNVPPFSAVSDANKHEEPLFSRAVFIFLAVFVGIFGVHDFYVKRIRYGQIHLALMSPWILVFLVSILGVFGVTAYALLYSPNRGEIRKIQRDIRDGEKDMKDRNKEIRDCMGEIEETERKLAEVMAGRLRKQREIIPRPDAPREIVLQPDEPREIVPRPDEPREIVPRPGEPREIVPRPPRIEIDEEYARELENLLRELQSSLMILRDSLRTLERQQEGRRDALDALRLQQGALRAQAWIALGPLWLYFLFFVLPCASWIMAMIEIIYVRKDGIGRPMGF